MMLGRTLCSRGAWGGGAGCGALAVKISLIVEHEVGTLSGGEDCIALLERHAVRLAGVD